MFHALIGPSSGVCDYVGELTHWPFLGLLCDGVGVRFE